MRLLIFNWQDRNHPEAGGAETHLHEIFGRIARMGHSVTLLSCAFEGAPEQEMLDGIQVIRRGSRSTFNYTVPLWWRKEGVALSPDIIIDDINKIPFMTPMYVKRPILGLIHHLFGESIYSEVGRISGTYVSFFERRIPKVYRQVPFAVVSDSTKKECIELGLPGSNLHVIHNGIEPKDFPMRVGEKAGVPTVVYFGRLKRYKSVDHVVQAFALVRRSVPNAHLQIIGRGDDLPLLRDLVLKNNLGDSVEFRGWVSGEEKIALLSHAHVAVNPSIKEGWGITNMEANACGTPVVSADVPGLRDSVSNGVSGILYQYGKIEQLAGSIVRVLLDDDLRSRLSEGAVHWASSFTWDRSAHEMLALCQQTISQWPQD
ncbi:MAG: glycosyltransferase family 4 protein [Candidatus Kapabacteria bacterium]|nr:glycosyltransferase family 4 protein [Candidatus Kapabacteria bacterium]